MKIEHFERLTALMGEAVDRMNVKDPKVYGNYLAQTFYYVSHSTRLLALAAGLMKRDEESHFRRFVKHIGEETAHEILAEKDLEDLNMKPSDFEQLPETRAFWEAQYYKIQHQSPFALMGYIIALEHFACTHLPRLCPRVLDTYQGKANRFNKLHAEEDPIHTEKALELTQTLPQHLQDLILININQTARIYASMIDRCGTAQALNIRATIESTKSHEMFA